MNNTEKPLINKGERKLSDYSFVFMLVSVSALMAFITLPHEMVNLFWDLAGLLLR